MKKFRQLLALFLVCAAISGICTAAAALPKSIEDYGDCSSIKFTSAVNMMTALGVLNGSDNDGDGIYSFNPGSSVTRAEFSKMLAYVSNGSEPTVSYGSSPFSDVAAGYWALPSIVYCAEHGMVNGRGDGTFDPSGNITTAQAAKMVLCLIGYDAQKEGLIGADWMFNSVLLASRLGIFQNFEGRLDNSYTINREEAALLIFNVLDIPIISGYNEIGYPYEYADARTLLKSVYGLSKVTGTVLSNEWASVESSFSSTTSESGKTLIYNPEGVFDSFSGPSLSNDTLCSFDISTPVSLLGCEVSFYIRRENGKNTVYGVPSLTENNRIFTSGSSFERSADLEDASGLDFNTKTRYFINFEETSGTRSGLFPILRGSTTTLIDSDNDGYVNFVLVIQPVFTKVTAYSQIYEYLTLESYDGGSDKKLSFAETVGYESAARNEYVLACSYGGRTYITLADYVEGIPLSPSRDKNNEQYFCLNGSGLKYYESDIYCYTKSLVAFSSSFSDSMSSRTTELRFYLDTYGNVIAYKYITDISDNIAMIKDLSYYKVSSRNEIYSKVTLLFPDNHSDIFLVDMVDSAKRSFDYLNWTEWKNSGSDSSLNYFGNPIGTTNRSRLELSDWYRAIWYALGSGGTCKDESLGQLVLYDFADDEGEFMLIITMLQSAEVGSNSAVSSDSTSFTCAGKEYGIDSSVFAFYYTLNADKNEIVECTAVSGKDNLSYISKNTISSCILSGNGVDAKAIASSSDFQDRGEVKSAFIVSSASASDLLYLGGYDMSGNAITLKVSRRNAAAFSGADNAYSSGMPLLINYTVGSDGSAVLYSVGKACLITDISNDSSRTLTLRNLSTLETEWLSLSVGQIYIWHTNTVLLFEPAEFSGIEKGMIILYFKSDAQTSVFIIDDENRN